MTSLALTRGSRLGPYEILSVLGAGGMGEVYRATDTNLRRQVAIKVLPAAVAEDAERLSRFQREAEVLAALNHQNIAHIHGLEKSDRTIALVMELVEGPTLADRIAKGAIPVDEALLIAKQIADALEAAHEQGIIHRDLKPANIKVREDGTVKVLDFGLAKLVTADAVRVGPAAALSQSPTVTTPAATMAGIILGTAAYMSPEQARGKTVDRRADIWAFGVVLYEILTGQRLFGGEEVSDTLAAVLRTDPNWSALPAVTPVGVRRLLHWCLEKDPKRRLQAIGDARIVIEDVLTGARQEEPSTPTSHPRRSILPWAAVSALAIMAAFGWWMAWRLSRPVDHPLQRFSVDLGPDAVAGLITAAISPDGNRLVFLARGPDGKQQLAMRLLDQAQSTLLPGTENGDAPFFKPDGQWIGFFAERKLKKISVHGGAVSTLCDAPDGRGAAWGEDDNIIATLDANAGIGLSRVSAAGGIPQELTHPAEKGEATHRWPQILPGGQAVLFMGSKTAANYDNSSIEVLSLKTGEVKVVQPGGYFGRYLATSKGSGYLVYINRGTLFGVAFDLDRLAVRGAAGILQEDVAGNPNTGSGQFDFSRNGTLVYSSGKSSSGTFVLKWIDSAGNTRPLLSSPGKYFEPRISPDGGRLVFSNNSDIELYDIEREIKGQLTFTNQTRTNEIPVWAPDGRHIVFESQGTNDFSLQWIRADGSGGAQQLWQNARDPVPHSFSPDGTRLAFGERNGQAGSDHWTLPLDLSDPEHPKPGNPELLLVTPSAEGPVAFSPDGHWIAYQASASDHGEVFVCPFRPAGPPASGMKISTDGGRSPMWSRDGQRLFYEGPDNRIMVATYSVHGDSFEYERPRLWSTTRILAEFDLAPDGKRFAIQASPEADSAGGATGSVHVTFLQNFFDEVHRRLP